MDSNSLTQSIEVIHAINEALTEFYFQFVPKWKGNELSLVDIKSIPDIIKCENRIIELWDTRRHEIECAFQQRADEGKGPTFAMENLFQVLGRCNIAPAWGRALANGRTMVSENTHRVQCIIQQIIIFYWFSFKGTNYDVEHASPTYKGEKYSCLYFSEKEIEERTPRNEDTTEKQRNNKEITAVTNEPTRVEFDIPDWLPKDSYTEQVDQGNIIEANYWVHGLQELTRWLSVHIPSKGESHHLWSSANNLFRYKNNEGKIVPATTKALTNAWYDLSKKFK